MLFSSLEREEKMDETQMKYGYVAKVNNPHYLELDVKGADDRITM